MQVAKRRGSRERTLAGVINGVALCTMFACETQPTPRIGLCESGPAQQKYDRRNDSRDLRRHHAVITKAWTIADGRVSRKPVPAQDSRSLKSNRDFCVGAIPSRDDHDGG